MTRKDSKIEINDKLIDFAETTFLSGFDANYGKILVKLELVLEFFKEDNSIKIGVYAGFDKVYKISEIGRFLKCFENGTSYYLSKNFIFEPSKMCFSKIDTKVLEFFYYIKRTRVRIPHVYYYKSSELNEAEIILGETECGYFLDTIWNDIGSLCFNKQSAKVQFENEVHIRTSVENKGGYNLLVMDYSEYGDFYPLTLDFKYIAFYEKGIIVKLTDDKRNVISNLFNFKNSENVVFFRVGEKEKKQFHKNFIEKYKEALNISIDKDVEREINAASLLSRAYFDLSPKGIVSKLEFNYGDKAINPLDDTGSDKSFREFDRESKILSSIKLLGFREYGRLFILDDTEKLCFC